MAFLSPVERLHKTNQDCIHCGADYDATVGGLVWHGKDRQYLICPKCATMVVAGLANDLAELLYPGYSGAWSPARAPSVHYVPYLQRAAHAIEVKNGLRHWAESMSRQGEVSNWMLDKSE